MGYHPCTSSVPDAFSFPRILILLFPDTQLFRRQPLILPLLIAHCISCIVPVGAAGWRSGCCCRMSAGSTADCCCTATVATRQSGTCCAARSAESRSNCCSSAPKSPSAEAVVGTLIATCRCSGSGPEFTIQNNQPRMLPQAPTVCGEFSSSRFHIRTTTAQQPQPIPPETPPPESDSVR